MDAREILHESGMSSRPEYYSGRGATLSDLNYNILTKIAKLLVKHQGTEAKTAFVAMVAEMPKLTATDFINNFLTLAANDWKPFPLIDQHGIEAANTGDASDFGINMATIAGVLGGLNDRDDTDMIRDQFLAENGVEGKCIYRRRPRSIWG